MIECVTVSACTSGRDEVTTDVPVAMPQFIGLSGAANIRCIVGPHGAPGVTVRSTIEVLDIRRGTAAPMDEATQATRRLRQQIDQQCLRSYPIVERTSAS